MCKIKKEESTLHYLIRLIKVYPRRSYLALGIILVMFMAGLTIYFSYLIKRMVDSAINHNLDILLSTVFFVIVLSILEIVVSYLKTRILGIYTEGGVTRLRRLLGEKAGKLPYDYFMTNHSGDYVSRATNDIGKIRNFTSGTVTRLISIPLTAAGALVYLLFLNWKLTIISLLLTPVLLLGAKRLSAPMRPISKKLQKRLGRINSIVQDVIKGIEITKAFNLEGVLADKYNLAVEDSVESAKELAKKKAVLGSFSRCLGVVPFFTTFFLGGYWAIRGEMTAGSLLAFINLLNHLTHPLGQLPGVWGQAKSGLAAAERIFEVLDYTEERKDGRDFNLINKQDIIGFKDVSFTYPDNSEKILKNINFTVHDKESVALVGPSGEGKSTVMHLLLGYYENYQGKIEIGGHELKKWNLKALRNRIAFVSQDPFLFPESIKENIQYGSISSSTARIRESAQAANAHQFIKSLAGGYATDAGELGNKLSGGQKQRIALARAILKDAEILLLDEPTSALDTESEAIVQEALDKLINNKTCLIIAHRLTTIKNVDRILVISNGTIIEQGTHTTLLKNNGLYSKLYYKQLRTGRGEHEVIGNVR